MIETYLKQYAVPASLILGFVILLIDFVVGPKIPIYILYLLPLLIFLRFIKDNGALSASIICILVLIGIANVRVGWGADLIGRLLFTGVVWLVYFTLKMYTDQSRKVKELQQRVDDKEAQLTHFAYVASHDLNEPLRSLTSFTEILNEEHKDEFKDETATYFRFISEASLRMKGLIDGLLQYSRLGRNRKRRPLSLRDLFLKLSEEMDLPINYDAPPIINAMEKETRILFKNLFENSSKFRSEDKPLRIEVAVDENEEDWEFKVSDNGIGIDEKNHAKVFHLFTKLHAQSKFNGRGLGLALCHRVVELHGGNIIAETNKSGGTTIKFNFKKEEVK
ncbi:sensor histidine kinase [Portibacter marinus]|uniref:sensor histidine kinase n=1 Tax=Portibacter marinus TaxID=2898660 RepID=UPI001F1FB2A3|nr:ATP-binding protein [Portibacter marinus]